MKTRLVAGAVALLAFAAVFLSPLLHAGHAADDMFAANIRGFVDYYHYSIWQFIHIYNDRMYAQLGRLFPGAVFVQAMTYYLSPEPLPVKIVQEIMILLNLATFAVFVQQLTRSRLITVITTLVAIASYQFRYFYDPYISFVITLPLMLEFGLLAAIFMMSYIERGGVIRLVASYAMFTISCLTYEVIYPYFLIYGLIAFWQLHNRRKATTITLGYVGITLVLILIDVVMRRGIDFDNPAKHSEYAISHDYVADMTTFWWQCINALPVSYRYFDPKYLFEKNAALWQASGRVAGWALGIVAAVALALAAWAAQQKPPSNRTNSWRAYVIYFIVGMLFWTLPATLISLSPRWHEEVTPGNGYLPIYFETYGSALAIAILMVVAIRSAGRFGRFGRALVIGVLAIGLAGAISSTYRANAMVVAMYNREWTVPRNTLRDAFSNHVFDDTPEGTMILPTGPYPFIGVDGWFWDTRYTVYLYAHKRVAFVPTRSIGSEIRMLCTAPHADCAHSGEHTATLLFAVNPSDAYVVVANDARLDAASGTAAASDALIWERNDAFRSTPPLRPSMIGASSTSSSDYRIVKAADDWALFKYQPKCPFDPHFLEHGDVVWYKFDPNFFGYEYAGKTRFNWSHASSAITLSNGSSSSQRATFTFALVAPSPGLHHFTVSWPGHHQKLTLGSEPVPERIRIALAPFASSVIAFRSDTPVVPKSASDPRDLHFQVVNDSVSSTADPTTAGCK